MLSIKLAHSLTGTASSPAENDEKNLLNSFAILPGSSTNSFSTFILLGILQFDRSFLIFTAEAYNSQNFLEDPKSLVVFLV